MQSVYSLKCIIISLHYPTIICLSEKKAHLSLNTLSSTLLSLLPSAFLGLTHLEDKLWFMQAAHTRTASV